MHYIADDLGIHRDYGGLESGDVVTALTWEEIENIVIEEGLLDRLKAETKMDGYQ